ncbi:MAG: NAD(P)/FAD-dependent oxidoreductase [Alphaproteobacteria bacterium]
MAETDLARRVGDVSFWYADHGMPQTRRPALPGDTAADVAIIGAGYTGLWTAYYLRQAAPNLRVVVLEKDFAGFGASGRNGGWCMGSFAWHHERYARTHGRDSVLNMVAALHQTVPEIARVCAAEGIDADLRETEELMVASNPAQLQRLNEEIEHLRHWGEGPRLKVLSADDLRQRISMPGALGAASLSGMLRVQPAKLVRGLADAVERAGAEIFEDTEVLDYAPNRVTTAHGTVTAPIILRATEGFTASLPGHRREWLPLNSAQIATVPLPPEAWAKIGWEGHELIGDMANSYCYCQRTREGRITVGSRGVPYRYGSAMDQNGAPDPVTIQRLIDILHQHFPEAAKYPIDHAWCGVIGVPRDWCATVGLDPATGLGWAGGYVGVGVSTANLAGQTLADLALGHQTDRTALPWVNRRVRPWEPEPLRWIGVHAMYGLLHAADRRESRSGQPASTLARLGHWITGR